MNVGAKWHKYTNEYMWHLMLKAKVVNTRNTMNAIKNKELNYQNKIEIKHDKCLILRAK